MCLEVKCTKFTSSPEERRKKKKEIEVMRPVLDPCLAVARSLDLCIVTNTRIHTLILQSSFLYKSAQSKALLWLSIVDSTFPTWSYAQCPASICTNAPAYFERAASSLLLVDDGSVGSPVCQRSLCTRFVGLTVVISKSFQSCVASRHHRRTH